jgi:hypothetical protein
MSWRIEEANSLTLVRELPDAWAQTCITRPPSIREPEVTLAVLSEVHRVLRQDGTLWLLLHPGEALLDALCEQGWIRQLPPAWATPLMLGCNTPLRLSLLSKDARYFYEDHTPGGHLRPRRFSSLNAGRQVRRTQGCHNGPEQLCRLVKRCVLAGSSLVACGACGAPYRRALPGERGTPGVRRPTCPHNNPDGRCLVLDPFYHPANCAAGTAHCNGRSFLGITSHTETSEDR